MSNFKETLKKTKDKVWKWSTENKEIVIVGIIGLLGAGAYALTTAKSKEHNELNPVPWELEEEGCFDTEGNEYGRELKMQFVDPVNGEVLGSIDCYESYMRDMMEIEEIAKEQEAK